MGYSSDQMARTVHEVRKRHELGIKCADLFRVEPAPIECLAGLLSPQKQNGPPPTHRRKERPAQSPGNHTGAHFDMIIMKGEGNEQVGERLKNPKIQPGRRSDLTLSQIGLYL
jgi:hypothetical protein